MHLNVFVAFNGILPILNSIKMTTKLEGSGSDPPTLEIIYGKISQFQRKHIYNHGVYYMGTWYACSIYRTEYVDYILGKSGYIWDSGSHGIIALPDKILFVRKRNIIF